MGALTAATRCAGLLEGRTSDSLADQVKLLLGIGLFVCIPSKTVQRPFQYPIIKSQTRKEADSSVVSDRHVFGDGT